MRIVSPLLQMAFTFAFLTLTTFAGAPPYNGELFIKPAVNASKCLTAVSNNDGAWVIIQPCAGSPSQEWTFTRGMVQVFGDKCLDVTNGANADGTKMQIMTCASQNPNQQWFYDNWVNIVWTDKNKCLDLPNGQQYDGNHIQVWTCYSVNPNQAWNMYNLSGEQIRSSSPNRAYGSLYVRAFASILSFIIVSFLSHLLLLEY